MKIYIIKIYIKWTSKDKWADNKLEIKNDGVTDTNIKFTTRKKISRIYKETKL